MSPRPTSAPVAWCSQNTYCPHGWACNGAYCVPRAPPTGPPTPVDHNKSASPTSAPFVPCSGPFATAKNCAHGEYCSEAGLCVADAPLAPGWILLIAIVVLLVVSTICGAIGNALRKRQLRENERHGAFQTTGGRAWDWQLPPTQARAVPNPSPSAPPLTEALPPPLPPDAKVALV